MRILEGRVTYEKATANIQWKKVTKLERELVATIAAWRVIKVELMTSKEKAASEKSSATIHAKL